MHRPAFLLALAAAGARPVLASARTVVHAEVNAFAGAEPFAREEARGRGRLGVAALDLRDGRTIGQRETERFPLASTFKLPLVMDVLRRVDDGSERLERKVRFTADQLVNAYSPVVGRYPRGGALTIAELCAAAIEQSDNNAANLLLATLGGPPGVTSYLRGLGDTVTRLDNTEPALNRDPPGDPRDTTTPRAMANLLARLVREPVISARSKAHLFGWLRGARTGLARIRAGVPADWTVGDKTGTTDSAANDVAILWRRSGPPVVLAIYFAEVHESDDVRDAAIASVAREVVRRFR